MAGKKSKLYISMLGDFSLSYNGRTISDQNVRSKKFWRILEYLIAFRDKDISQSELLELVYPGDKSDNPGNALKTMIHRVRNELDELKYPESRKMIIQSHGSYAWNTGMDYVIDAEEFESLCKKNDSPAATDDEKLDFCLKAIELYKGDFLQKSALELWVAPYNEYYHTMYCDTVHKAVDILKQKNNYERLVGICMVAVNIAPFDESLYYNLILGLIKTGNPQAALSEYRKMCALFYREFGVNPSGETMKLYREIVKTSKKIETDLNIIKEDMVEDVEGNGAFFCEYEMFKDIYRLELRSKPRTGETIYLCLFTLASPDGGIPSVKLLNSFMDKLQVCIKENLRNNDVFAQYSVSQYIALLALTNFENAGAAIKRIERAFHKQYPYCPLSLVHSLQQLDAHI